MRTLLIDNYDSFTYNLYQLLSVVNGTSPTVVRNDEAADLDLDSFDNIVISPGPGHPAVPRDFGISAQIIRRSRVPLLGVCLGHQGIVVAEGGTVSRAPTPRHGYLERIRHDGRELFAGLPQDFTVVRYHSLAADLPLPDSLEPTAWSSDGVVMALRHRERPLWGVQFHPESIATEFGEQLLANFAKLTKGPAAPVRGWRVPGLANRAQATCRLNVDVIDRAVDTEAAFDRLYSTAAQAFWLDSEHVEPGLDRFSFMGDAAGPLAEQVSYRTGDECVSVTSAAGQRALVPGSIFDYLSAQLRERRVDNAALPFDFTCGYVGYFGYELKAECGSPNRHEAQNPDAQWLFADRIVAVDHQDDKTYLLALDDRREDGPAGRSAACEWLARTRSALDDVASWTNPPPLRRTSDHAVAEKLLTRDEARYRADIEACQAHLRAGDSYEICLTNSARGETAVAGIDVYRILRRANPAPYAAYLRLPGVEVACSSPERFLKVDRAATVESKPIKGTARRGLSAAEDDRLRAELLSSSKTRAENLIIVDLLRNDLGRVCEIGSVHVPKLMAIESYSTMHQLVSTVRGRLAPGVDAIDCVRACFPGGSMTGAPKLRTLEIIDALETEARGIYSGAIGFLGLNGTADLNIVIRTAVLTEGAWHIGAGGAIVLDSDASEEYEEMVLKLLATLRAL
ncbi:aminodeoxychorismate synthase component I [Antrihabitans sp. YC2-6]|nr:aminodeoxychorismate synthase component I [Antrihabitans sp. YC2-6]